jgi:hypothetical protein
MFHSWIFSSSHHLTTLIHSIRYLDSQYSERVFVDRSIVYHKETSKDDRRRQKKVARYAYAFPMWRCTYSSSFKSRTTLLKRAYDRTSAMHAQKSALYRFATVWSTCATLSLSSKQEYPMQPRTQMINEQTILASHVQ